MKILILIFASLSGCHVITPRIVTTEIERTEHGFRITSPKDTTIIGLALVGSDLTVDYYEAKASPDALQAGSQEAANRSAAVGKLAEAAAAIK